jgi:hypothetical protein
MQCRFICWQCTQHAMLKHCKASGVGAVRNASVSFGIGMAGGGGWLVLAWLAGKRISFARAGAGASI